jgi:trigger factor
MSYTIESLNSCTKKFVFNFESVDLSEHVESALKEKQKSSNMKGFRKGKAPLSMIKQLYGPQVENDALYQFVSREFYNAIQSEGVRAVGFPRFSDTKHEDNNVSFNATVEFIPEIQINDYTKYEFTKDSDLLADNEVEDTVKRYLDSRGEVVEIKEDIELANGHTAVMNFEGEKEDGERPDNMKGTEFLLEIGSGQFIPGFEEGMLGMKKGNKKTIDLTFPAEYQEESLKNAKVKFHVELLEIKEKKIPELTDDLAKEFGFESAADMNEKTEERLKTQKNRQVNEKLHQEILDKLVEENKFEVPSTLISEQKSSLQKDLTANLKQQGFNDEMVSAYFEKWAEDLTTKAEFQVKSGLILDTLANKYEVKASDSDLDAKIEEMASQTGMTADQVKEFYLSNENVKNNLMYAIREEKTFEKFKEEVTIK